MPPSFLALILRGLELKFSCEQHCNMARLIDMGQPARASQLLDTLLATPSPSPHYRAIVPGYQAMVFNARADWHAAWRSLGGGTSHL